MELSLVRFDQDDMEKRVCFNFEDSYPDFFTVRIKNVIPKTIESSISFGNEYASIERIKELIDKEPKKSNGSVSLSISDDIDRDKQPVVSKKINNEVKKDETDVQSITVV